MMRRVGAVTLAATISKMPRSKDGRTTSGLLAHEERNEAADIHGGVSEDQTVGLHKRPKARTRKMKILTRMYYMYLNFI